MSSRPVRSETHPRSPSHNKEATRFIAHPSEPEASAKVDPIPASRKRQRGLIHPTERRSPPKIQSDSPRFSPPPRHSRAGPRCAALHRATQPPRGRAASAARSPRTTTPKRKRAHHEATRSIAHPHQPEAQARVVVATCARERAPSQRVTPLTKRSSRKRAGVSSRPVPSETHPHSP